MITMAIGGAAAMITAVVHLGDVTPSPKPPCPPPRRQETDLS